MQTKNKNMGTGIYGVEGGYYVDTVEKNPEKIQEYIKNKIQEDWEYDQMSLKKYIDPFTGEPVKKANKKAI